MHVTIHIIENIINGVNIVLSTPTAMASLSNYAVRMARLSARIFGDVVRPTDSKSMKVVQLFKEPPMAQSKEVYDWYPQHRIYYAMTQKLRYMGLFRYYGLTCSCQVIDWLVIF